LTVRPNKLVRVAALVIAIGVPFMAFQMGRLGVRDVLAAEPVPPRSGVEEFPSLAGATGWLNSSALSPADLRGKVVLIDFWTYSCINWRRSLPYVRAWAAKYKDAGLVVVGVHTPEFGFEKDVDNIRWALRDMRVDYPVAIDSDYRIWNAFGNQYWPAIYLIDAKGRIRDRQFGEGEYERSERTIQQLLAEAGSRGVAPGLVQVDGQGAEAPPDFRNLQSPETYVGYARTENFASPGGIVLGTQRRYALPSSLRLNSWALSGTWTVREQAAVVDEPGGRIALRFHARDVHLVMGPKTRGTPVRFRVLIDGAAPVGSHGVDVDDQGNGTASEQRMYQLIRQANPIGDRRFEIEFLDPGIEVFSFTFG
jgi:thiol-disulfide isomerase/thioredoxin